VPFRGASVRRIFANVTEPSGPPPQPDARGPLDHAYARGFYAALLVLATLPVLGLVVSGVELAVVLFTVRGAADVGHVTVIAVVSPFLLLGVEVALFVALLRRPTTPAGLERGSWVLPILIAVASLIGFAGSMGLRILSTHVIAAHGAMAFAVHSQRLAAVQAVAGMAGAAVVATVLLVAFARSRPR
jgi:hypothetical protein